MSEQFLATATPGALAWQYKQLTDNPTNAIPTTSLDKPQSYNLAGIPVFKLYQNVPRFSLQYPLPTSLNPAAVPNLSDWEKLTVLLHFTLGVNQLLNLPSQAAIHGSGLKGESHISSLLRRHVPSGGALYPSELYLWVGGFQNLPDGIYHYDPAHHQLAQLRQGDFRVTISEALNLPLVDLESVNVAVFAALRLNKNVPKYGDFSYRVQSLDSGVVQGRLIELSEAIGWQAQVYWQFADEKLHLLLGLPGVHESVHHVTLLSDPTAVASSITPPSAPLTPLSGSYNYNPEATPVTPTLGALQASAFCSEPARIVPKTTPKFSEPAFAPRQFDLYKAIKYRYSNGAAFDGAPLEAETLLNLARAGYKAWHKVAASDTQLNLQLYFLALRVNNLEPGAYKYNPVTDSFEQSKAHSDLSLLLSFANFNFYVANFNPDKISAVFYPVGDYSQALPRYADRTFRLLNLAAGWAVENVQTAAAGYDYDTANFLGFETKQVNQLLGLPDNQESLMQLFIGHSRPGTAFYRGFLS